MNSPLLEDVPFLSPVHMYTCDNHGTKVSVNGVRVTIPPGAVPDGVVINIEMGVALYGPFKFSDNHQQVSPILWFCVRENVQLLLPIKFKLPHIVTNTSIVDLSFAKTNDCTYDSTMKREMFAFKSFVGGISDFTNCDLEERKLGYGCLSSAKHRYFLCIEAKTSEDLALEKGYCVHTLIEKIDSSSYRILHVCTYFLKTCFDASHTYPFGCSAIFIIALFLFAGIEGSISGSRVF